MNLVLFYNSNGLMNRFIQITKGGLFFAAIIDRQLYDAEGRSDHPQRAASGTAWSGTLGGSYR